MGKVIIYIGVAITLTGCAMSNQKFVDESYEDGMITRRVIGKSTVIVPPLKNSQGVAQHQLEMAEGLKGWLINMGSESKVSGGELTPDVINAIKLIGSL
jgi:hypothetical protein